VFGIKFSNFELEKFITVGFLQFYRNLFALCFFVGNLVVSVKFPPNSQRENFITEIVNDDNYRTRKSC